MRQSGNKAVWQKGGLVAEWVQAKMARRRRRRGRMARRKKAQARDGRITLVEGRVVDGEGVPVPQARVDGCIQSSGMSSSFTAEATGRDGNFKVTMARGGPRFVKALLLAHAAGYSTSEELWSPVKGKKGYRPVKLVLRPAVDFAVHVVDDEGAPVKDATVTIAEDSWNTAHPMKGKELKVDSSGRVVFRSLELKKGGELHCRVLDMRTGEPVLGLLVACTYGSIRRTTDDNGEFSIPDLPFGTVPVYPMGRKYGTDYDNAYAGHFVSHAPGTMGRVLELRARRNFDIQGKVVDSKGKGIAGIDVVLLPVLDDIRALKRPPMETTKTGPKGKFAFGSFSCNKFKLSVGWDTDKYPEVFEYEALKGPVKLVVKKETKSGRKLHRPEGRCVSDSGDSIHPSRRQGGGRFRPNRKTQ
jgi:hypothetical protein